MSLYPRSLWRRYGALFAEREGERHDDPPRRLQPPLTVPLTRYPLSFLSLSLSLDPVLSWSLSACLADESRHSSFLVHSRFLSTAPFCGDTRTTKLLISNRACVFHSSRWKDFHATFNSPLVQPRHHRRDGRPPSPSTKGSQIARSN